MRKRHFVTTLILAMASLLLSNPSYSQDKDLLAKADSLYQLGQTLINNQKYEDAIVLFESAVEIRRMQLGDYSDELASCFNSIGVCYSSLGNYGKALEYHQQALPIKENIFGKEHPDYAACLYDIGRCYIKLADYTNAIEYQQRALEIIEHCFGKEHPDYAKGLNDLGVIYRDLADCTKALEYLQGALEIREHLFGKEHPSYAASLNNSANCYLMLGSYSMALDYYEWAFKINERALGIDHPNCATYLLGIANTYEALGDYVNAIKYHERSLEIRKKVLGDNHPDYAMSLNNIANCFASLGNYEKAFDFHKMALEIRKKVLGDNHPDYAMSLANIGNCLYDMGRYSEAIEYYKPSLLIWAKTLGDHPSYAEGLSGLGDCYNALGDYSTALNYYKNALEIRENIFGKEHPDYSNSLSHISLCLYEMNDFKNASQAFTLFIESISSVISYMFYSFSESLRASFWGKYSGFFTNNLFDYTFTIHSVEMNRQAYNGSLLGKGLLLNAETELRKLILESGDEEALTMYNEVQESRVKLDRLYENPVGKKEKIDSLNNDIEKRQQELMKRSKVFGDYTRNLALKWTDVQASLGKKDIAIEFETYTHQDTTFYIALTLRPGYTEPHLIKLFNSKDLSQITPKQYYTSTSMTELIWGNLSDELIGVKNVYFSPAGELNNIGIEYLLDKDGKHLISDKRNYYRLTSTRELAKEHLGKKMADATVYGGIRYDISPNSNLTGEETESERLALTTTRSRMPMDSLSVTRGGWVYLPGTKEEAEAISSTLSSRKVRNDLLEGENGTEESFKALSGAKRDVIHIATHGFYWTETEAARSGMETSSFMLDNESQAPKEDKALTRSGLLFAGAQNAFEGKDIPIDVEDGILTAKDISRMDLRGTDLVVISACQSGLGEVTGDGVFGLQRGFKKAGVQSIVMSLWEVDDTATKVMMTRFYENLAKGKSKYDSFFEAQNYLRKYDGGIYDEPEYYAAFVLLDAIK